MVDISELEKIDDPLVQLHQILEKILSYKEQELIRKPDWGTVNFEAAGKDITNIISVTSNLRSLPLAELAATQINNIHHHLFVSARALDAIDSFSINEMGIVPSEKRDGLVQEVTHAASGLMEVAAPLIGYLGFVKGNSAKTNEQLERDFDRVRRTLNQTEEFAAKTKADVEAIMTATREASASTGVATFTQQFDIEANKLKRQSVWWLLITTALAMITIGEIFLPAETFSVIEDHSTLWVIAQAMVTKAALIGVSLTGTLWCGTIYRALAHQAAVNRHRAVSLKTFQAFTEATDNQQTRDAVLLEATKAIFGYSPTGLIGNDQKQSVPGSIMTVGNLSRGVSPETTGNP